MYEVRLINKEGQRFSRYFNSEYLYRKFLEKTRRSSALRIVSYGKVM